MAVIGDMVGSRALAPGQRAITQRHFNAFVRRLNRRFASGLLAKFVITIGDEFQALVADGTIIPDLIWEMATDFHDRQLRLGFGWGRLDTPVPEEYAINVDGPALHHARNAVDYAKKRDEMGGIFEGFGENFDPLFDGLARLLWFQREQRTRQQLRIMRMLRKGTTQTEIANILNLTKQTISDHARAAGVEVYREGEEAFRAAMRVFDHTRKSEK